MNYSIDLDITPGGVPKIVKLSQYDKTMPVIQATLWNGSEAFTIPAGATVEVAGTKPDNHGFNYSATYIGSTVSITVTEQMTVVAGRVPCEVIVRSNGGRKGSANFFLDIEAAALSDNTDISETELPLIESAGYENVKLAEAWARGTKNGVPVPSTDETYENNAKYYAEMAAGYSDLPLTVVSGKLQITYQEG